MNYKAIFSIFIDSIGNLFSRKKLIFVIEHGWVVETVWNSINKHLDTPARVTTSRFLLRNKVVNYGSVNTLVAHDGIRRTHKSNKIILTWYHVEPEDKRVQFLGKLKKSCDYIITSSSITKKNLIDLGFPKERIIILPLGIDTELFRPAKKYEKENIRKRLGIPAKSVVIGSFQKDGVGWGEGNEPKLVKGPDVLCDALEELSKRLDIHVLLSGPSRGYVKNRLQNASINFTHVVKKKNEDVVELYKAIDLYMVSSRVEGGPMAILESLAAGVPLVTTKVGMAPDILSNGKDSVICRKADCKCLVEGAIDALKDKSHLVKNGLKTAHRYRWSEISKRYQDEVLSRL